MLGEKEAMVVEVKPFGLHGVTYYDVTMEFADRSDGLSPSSCPLADSAPP
jgi:hypothetical protein